MSSAADSCISPSPWEGKVETHSGRSQHRRPRAKLRGALRELRIEAREMIIGIALVVDELHKGQRLVYRYPESVPSSVLNSKPAVALQPALQPTQSPTTKQRPGQRTRELPAWNEYGIEEDMESGVFELAHVAP